MPTAAFLFTHASLERVWSHARDLLPKGVQILVSHQGAPFAPAELETCAAAYLDATRHAACFESMVRSAAAVPLAVPGGLDMQAALPSDDAEARGAVQAYVKAGTAEALAHAALYLLHRAGAWADSPPPPPEPVLAGVHHPAAATGPVVAVLFERTAWLNGETAAIDHCVAALEQAGLAPAALFCDAELGRRLGEPGHPLDRLLAGFGTRLAAIWNATGMHGRTEMEDGGPFARHGVPVFQLLRHWTADEAGWRAAPEGLSPMSVAFGIVRPEMAGCIDPTLFAVTDRDGEGNRRAAPVTDQVARLVGRTRAWIALRTRPNADKRIAILLHNPPCKGLEATIGNAVGLDALESVARLLRRLADEGYTVADAPESGQSLLDMILARKAISEFRWTNVEEIVAKGGALAFVDETAYRADFDALPAAVRDRVDRAWGPFPARSMVHRPADGPPRLVVAGLRFGNVLVLTDPKRGCWGARCDGEVCRILHEPDIPPPHHWLATYWYLQREADALIHMGAEGALEYLPGKRVGLSEDCFSTISLGDLPSLYPFVVNAPGEGLIAKRRGRAVMVGHLGAPVARADALGSHWDELEDLHGQFLGADGARAQKLVEMLRGELTAMGLLEETAGEDALGRAIDQLPRRLDSLRRRRLTVGRHVLGMVPDGERTALYIAEAGGDEAAVRAGLAACAAEQDAVVAALMGRFVVPGPGGHLSRMGADILPTGRNFHGIDVSRLPTAAAWAVGAEMGERLLNAYLHDEGRLPRRISITLWSSDAFQADGELTAQALWLLGCRPTRDKGGKVTGIEAIPLDEMDLAVPGGRMPRPRIDVTVQMSGVVRDTLPELYTLLDKAVGLVADLDEDDGDNFIRAHVREREAALVATLDGLPASALKRLARARLFSAADGTYGGGVSLALDASAWKDEADLAEALVNWNGHAHGLSELGKAGLGEFAQQLATADLSYQRQASPERDLLSISSYLDTQGGTAAAKRAMGGGAMRLYWGEGGSEIRSLKEELDLSLAASLLNPDWMAMTRRRGYAGARDVAERGNRLFAWSATARLVDKAQFDAVHDACIHDRDTLEWLREANVHALEELTRRLLEAQARGLWDADSGRLDELRRAVLDLEGDIEDRMGDAGGEFQGSSVDVLTRDNVSEWRYDFRLR
jgi:cobaltochelatase CobN